MLALVVSFVGGFFNSKETLPIEELLKARVSMLLFAVLGVLVAPLVEETIFRGFLYPVIARRVGIAAGIVDHRNSFRIDARGAAVGRLGTDRAADSGGHRADLGARADRHRGGQLFCAPRIQWPAAAGYLVYVIGTHHVGGLQRCLILMLLRIESEAGIKFELKGTSNDA